MAEADLLERFLARARGHHDAQTLLGPGDDGAIIGGLPRGLVISTDSFVEGSHYQAGWLSPQDLAWRCMGASLSDLAAMGAHARFVTLDLCLRGDESQDFIDTFASAFGAATRAYSVDLIGGDLVRSDRQSMSLTVMGTPPGGRALRRRGAKAGDGIWVSGFLGGAAAGLGALQRKLRVSADDTIAFRRPEPRLLLGMTMARMNLAQCAIDTSDGLAMDLGRLCKASGLGAQLNTAAMPMHPRVRRIAQRLDQDPLNLALHGGEDYELLFGVSPAFEEAMGDLSDATGVPLTRIGQFCDEPGLRNERNEVLSNRGWDPFS